MIEELIESIDSDDLWKGIEESLKYELAIYNKKNKGKKLSNEEYFFDTYMIKPSSLLTFLDRRCKK